MNGDLAVARAETAASLRAAELTRDAEVRRLRDEHRTVVEPLKRARQSNHFADIIRASLRGPG